MRWPSGSVTVRGVARRQARHRAQRRHQQHVGVRQARGRIAGHAEHRLAVDRAEHRRLARLHGDAVKHDLALAADHVEDQVALADRAAAGKHQHVARGARVDRALERLDRVLRGRERHRHAAVLLDDRAQRELVDVVDLPGLQLAARDRRSRCRSRESRPSAWRRPRRRRRRARRARRCGWD